MKFDIKYFYILLGVIVIGMVTFFIVSRDVEENKSKIPDDEFHRNLKMDPHIDESILRKIDSLETVLGKNPRDTITLHALGFIYLQAHKFDKALSTFENLLDLTPYRTDIMTVLAEVNFYIQKYEKSESYLKKILSIEKENNTARYNLGVLYLVQGKKDLAKKMWAEIVKKDTVSEIGKMAKNSMESIQ